MKKILTAAAISLFVATPVVSFAQTTDSSSSSSDSAPAATYPSSGGAAGGLATNQTLIYSGLAALGVAATVGAAIAVSNSGDDNKNVDLGGPTGGGGTTGTTGTVGQ